MSGKEKENNSANAGKIFATIVLTLIVIFYLAPTALQVIKKKLYRGRLNQLVQRINTGIDNKIAQYEESFLEMYSYTSDSLTPISYVFSRNSCEEPIDTEKFKQNIMPSICVDKKIISTSSICLIHVEPTKYINGKYYYMIYLDLDCKKGKFNEEYYKDIKPQTVDRYARDGYFDDVVAMIFEQSGENFYLKPFPDKNSDYYKKYHNITK